MSELEPVRPAAAIDYNDRKPALLFGNDPGRRLTAEGVLRSAGIRLVDSLRLDDAEARLEGQISLGLVWLELGEEDRGPLLERLLPRLNDLAESRRTFVVASAPLGLIDQAAAALTDRSTEILIDPDNAQRAATLAVAMSSALADSGVSDVGKDNAVRLRQLSDEVGRIASTLARLSTGPGLPAVKPSEANDEVPAIDADVVRSVIRARRLRSLFFADELFADPAWDMLLDLLQAEITQLRVPVSSLCIAASVPATTALRWIKTMTEQGLFVRHADPHDGRRVFVELAPAASEAMRRYFVKAGNPVAV